jgi:hypothetical protein
LIKNINRGRIRNHIHPNIIQPANHSYLLLALNLFRLSPSSQPSFLGQFDLLHAEIDRDLLAYHLIGDGAHLSFFGRGLLLRHNSGDGGLGFFLFFFLVLFFVCRSGFLLFACSLNKG